MSLRQKARASAKKAGRRFPAEKPSARTRCPRVRAARARHVKVKGRAAARGLRPVPFKDWVLVEKRYAKRKTEVSVKLPLGGDDNKNVRAYRVGLGAYTVKRRHPDDRRVAITRVYFYYDIDASALPDDYWVMFKLRSLRSDGRWKDVSFPQGIPAIQGGKNTDGALAYLDFRTTHSGAVITKVQIQHRVAKFSELGNAALLQVNTSLTADLHRVSKDFEPPPRKSF